MLSDLIPEVLLYLSDDLDDLRRANLVSHAWRHWACPLVVRTVAVTRKPGLVQFIQWASTPGRVVGSRDPLDHILQFVLLPCDRKTWDDAHLIEAIRLCRALRSVKFDDDEFLKMCQAHPSPSKLLIDAFQQREDTLQSFLPLPLEFARATTPNVNDMFRSWKRKDNIRVLAVQAEGVISAGFLEGYDNVAILVISKAGNTVTNLSSRGHTQLFRSIPTRNLVALHLPSVGWSWFHSMDLYRDVNFPHLRYLSLSITKAGAGYQEDLSAQTTDAALSRLLRSAPRLNTVRFLLGVAQSIDNFSPFDTIIRECPRLIAIQVECTMPFNVINAAPSEFTSLENITHIHVSSPPLLRFIIVRCDAQWFARLRTLVITADSMTPHLWDDGPTPGSSSLSRMGRPFDAISTVVGSLRDIEFLHLRFRGWKSSPDDVVILYLHELVNLICARCRRLSSLDVGNWPESGFGIDADFLPVFRLLMDRSPLSLKRLVLPRRAVADDVCANIAAQRGIKCLSTLGDSIFSVFRDGDRILGLAR